MANNNPPKIKSSLYPSRCCRLRRQQRFTSKKHMVHSTRRDPTPALRRPPGRPYRLRFYKHPYGLYLCRRRLLSIIPRLLTPHRHFRLLRFLLVGHLDDLGPPRIQPFLGLPCLRRVISSPPPKHISNSPPKLFRSPPPSLVCKPIPILVRSYLSRQLRRQSHPRSLDHRWQTKLSGKRQQG